MEYSAQENRMMWDYVLKNLDRFTGGDGFWRELVPHMKEGRTKHGLRIRFTRLSRKLYEADLDIMDKLKLCETLDKHGLLKTTVDPSHKKASSVNKITNASKESRISKQESKNNEAYTGVYQSGEMELIDVEEQEAVFPNRQISQQPTQPGHYLAQPYQSVSQGFIHEDYYDVEPREDQTRRMLYLLQEVSEQNKKQTEEMNEMKKTMSEMSKTLIYTSISSQQRDALLRQSLDMLQQKITNFGIIPNFMSLLSSNPSSGTAMIVKRIEEKIGKLPVGYDNNSLAMLVFSMIDNALSVVG